MDRKAIAKESLEIMRQGYYRIESKENQMPVQTKIIVNNIIRTRLPKQTPSEVFHRCPASKSRI